MYDIHTHLYWESYDADRDEVILHAHEAGVEKMFVVGCTIEESKQSVELAEKYGELFAVVGLHPHFFNENTFLLSSPLSYCHSREGGNPGSEENSGSRVRPGMTFLEECIVELKKIAKSSSKVVAIGECGLDYYAHNEQSIISEEQKALQKEGFLAQIQLARELNLPLIIHCRPSVGSVDAYEDMFDILQSASQQISIILHCYMGDTEVTKKFLTLPNIYFSFTANITYPVKKVFVGTKDDMAETVKMIPLERIFAETDCPFLAPQGKRGERNEPAYVVSVVEKIAEIRGLAIDEVKQSIDARVKHIFRI